MKYEKSLLFCGFPASGKSTALDVCRGFGDIFCYEMSDFVYSCFDESDTISDEVDDNALGAWASGLKEEYGQGYFAKMLVEEINDKVPRTKSVAVSGIRSPEEVMAFHESDLFDDVVVIGVVANEDDRWERVQEREGMDKETFHQRNKREERWGTNDVIRYADVWLENNYITEDRFRTKTKLTIQQVMDQTMLTL